jgi:rubrerythrin
LQLTRKGRDLFSQTPRQTEDFWQQTIGRLSPEQQARLVDSLRELKAVMEDPAWPSYEQLHARLAQPTQDRMQEHLEDLLHAEINAAGVRLVLARAAEDDGHPELAAYLNQAAAEELGHALTAARLLGPAQDWSQSLAELIDEEQAAHETLEDLARNLAEDGPAAVREFFTRAAADEGRHKQWFTRLRQQF